MYHRQACTMGLYHRQTHKSFCHHPNKHGANGHLNTSPYNPLTRTYNKRKKVHGRLGNDLVASGIYPNLRVCVCVCTYVSGEERGAHLSGEEVFVKDLISIPAQ